MCGQFDGGGGLVERKLMRDEFADIQFPREDEARDLFLEEEIRRVAANEILFVDTNHRQVQRRLFPSTGMRKEQNLTAATQEALGLLDGRIRRYRDHNRVQAASSGYLPDQ